MVYITEFIIENRKRKFKKSNQINISANISNALLDMPVYPPER